MGERPMHTRWKLANELPADVFQYAKVTADYGLPKRDILARLAGEFARDPRRAYIRPRTADPQTGVSCSSPHLDHDRGGTVAVKAEGIVMVRCGAFDAVGG
jgi:hypothetical protein